MGFIERPLNADVHVDGFVGERKGITFERVINIFVLFVFMTFFGMFKDQMAI